MNSLELKDKVAVVTGATAFIGRACAIRLAEQGATVVVSGRNAEAGAAVVAEIEAAGGRACFEAADLFDAGQMQAMADRVAARFGRIDVLVASGAGASHDSPSFRLFKDMDLEHYDQYLRAHFLARVYAIRALQPHLRDAGGGSMVMIGTDAGRVATVCESVLGGSTSGMMHMCRVLAREFGREKIRINIVAMSFISDAIPRWGAGSAALMADQGKGGMLENLRKRMLFDVTCRDIANAAAFFAGPQSAAITGQTLSVNGGLSTPG